MIRIEAGYRQIWPSFGLDIAKELLFEQGRIYQLKGPNGSGKSSFISQVLIPGLRQHDVWLLQFEQQAHLQLQAVKAWAAIFHPGLRVRDERDLVSFLLDDLERASSKRPRPIWIVADELHHLEQVWERRLSCCLIYSAHHQELTDAIPVQFEVLNPNRSVVSG